MIYEFKVTLRYVRPPVWRRIQLPGSISLEELHDALQIVMGWTNSHMHQFIKGKQYYGVPVPLSGDDMVSETSVSLAKVLPRKGAKLIYEYDFGDSWEHDIVVENILRDEDAPPAKKKTALCLAGKRASPPEDCGGPPGYENLLATLANPQDPEHHDMLEWIGGSFDPATFDLDKINRGLKRLKLHEPSARNS